MANIKELKVRIKSTKSTLKITSAMKLVSAAKLAKAQAKILGFKPYSSELDKTVRVCSALAADYTHEYLKEKEITNSIALLVISSDRGLCGGYNSQLLKRVKGFMNQNADKKIKLYFIGKKVRDLLMRDPELKVEKTFTFAKVDPTFDETKEVASELAQLFKKDNVSEVHIAYNSFVSAIAFDSKVVKALPLSASEEEKEELVESFPIDFKYEPSANEILDHLIPEVYTTTVFTAVLDAIAAEHGSRMTAMDNASNNCKDMIRSLTLKMNKLRQAAITTELTEIVSGAESLNS